MLVGQDYKIESDEMNITLSKRYLTKKGTEGWRVEGHFSSIANALRFLVDLKVKETGLKDIRKVESRQQELYTLIESLSLNAR